MRSAVASGGTPRTLTRFEAVSPSACGCLLDVLLLDRMFELDVALVLVFIFAVVVTPVVWRRKSLDLDFGLDLAARELC